MIYKRQVMSLVIVIKSGKNTGDGETTKES